MKNTANTGARKNNAAERKILNSLLTPGAYIFTYTTNLGKDSQTMENGPTGNKMIGPVAFRTLVDCGDIIRFGETDRGDDIYILSPDHPMRSK